MLDKICRINSGVAGKSINAMSVVERKDYLRALEFASPAFIEAVPKVYRMNEVGLIAPRGKIITNEQENRSGSEQGRELPRLPASVRNESPGSRGGIRRWKISRSISRKRGTIFIRIIAWPGLRRRRSGSSGIGGDSLWIREIPGSDPADHGLSTSAGCHPETGKGLFKKGDWGFSNEDRSKA